MLKIFSVYDVKVGAYMNPTLMRSSGEAIRAFSSACNSQDHDFYRYAEDYVLFELGEWDEVTASVNMHHVPLPLSKAIEASRLHSEYYYAPKVKEKVANE